MPDKDSTLSLPLVDKASESSRLPLVVNVVARYWGEEIPTAHHEKMPLGGIPIIEGIELAESHGLASFIYQSSMEDLKKRIDQRIPPIVIMPGIQNAVQHAMVISGYSISERRIFTYVPEPDALGAIPERRFEQEWLQDNLTAIVLVPNDMKSIVEKDKVRFAVSNRIYFEAERLWQRGRAGEAKARLVHAIEIEQDNPQIWCLLASIHNDLGAADAVKCYEQAIKLNPAYYLAYRGLGNYYLKAKDFAKAEDYYTRAIEINTNRFASIYKNRALSRIELAKSDLAKEDFITYLNQFPDAPDAPQIKEALKQM